MPFFSVVIPSFNRAHLIGKTIESVINQTFTDFELIIVDDGSTDDTEAVINNYTDARIHYVYQENGERGKARNTGTQLAGGNYVFFLDSDDLLYSHHLQHGFDQIERLEQPAFFSARYTLINGEKKKPATPLTKKTIKAKTVRQNPFACQFYLRRDVALMFPFSENRNLKIGEDWEVILKIAVRFPLYFSNQITAAIVVHSERTMEVAAIQTILESRTILIENLTQDLEITTKIRENVWVELTTLAALSASINGDKKQALTLLKQAAARQKRVLYQRRTLAILKKILLNGKA